MKKNEYIISIISKLVLISLSFLNSILINRYLGVELRGEYAFIVNTSNIFTIIIGFNIASAYPYFRKNYGDNIVKRFVNIIFLQTGLYLLGTIILSFFIQKDIVIYIIALCVTLQFSNQLDFISIILDVNKRNKIMIASAITNTSILLLFYFLIDVKLIYIISSLVLYNALRVMLYIHGYKLWPSRIERSTLSFIKIIKYSSFSMIISLFTIFNYNIDVIILKMYVDNRDIGLYSVGVTLATMMWIIPDAFKDVLFNKTAKNDSIKAIILSIKVNIYISLLIIIGFVFFGKYFISVFYGIEYSDAYYVSTILLLGTIPMIFFKLINTLYQAIGKQKYSFIILLCSVLINVIVSFLIIPLVGIIGAAVATVGSYMVCGIIMFLSFAKKYRIDLKSIVFFSSNEINIIKKVIFKS